MELWATARATDAKVYRIEKETWKNNGSKTCSLNVDTKYDNTTSESENPWATGLWEILGQYWGTAIHTYFILALFSAKRGGGVGQKQWTFLLLKSKHRTGLHCLSPPSSTLRFLRQCCPCSQALRSSRGFYSTWAPPWGLSNSTEVTRPHSWTLGFTKLLCCSSHPACPGCQSWLQSTAHRQSSPGGKGSSDGCTGPSVTIFSRWPHCEAPGLLEGLQCGALVPCPSVC